MKQIADIKKVLILGSGTLGLRIGLRSALSGFETTIYNPDQGTLDKDQITGSKLLRGMTKREMISPNEADEALARITWSTDQAQAAAHADLVSESVTEDEAIKKQVWKEFGALLPSDCIMTTNTSYMVASQFAEESGRPDLFCAFHFHDVFYANVVDIMPHPNTADWVVDTLMELGRRLHQTPVFVKKETPGYLFNNMLLAFIGAAGALVTQDVASIHDIDRSWMGNFKMPNGPFGILDEVGLDTAWHITNSRADKKSKAFAALLKTYIDQGKLGVKTGEGFYQYPNPAYKQEGFVEGK